MNKQMIKPNVVRGGIAIPIDNNTYYMKGRKHINGGIDVGKNPKTGLEVEDGEVMHLTKNNTTVFSAVPFLKGKSPAEKVINGEDKDKVFKEQESFKKINNINNDGTIKPNKPKAFLVNYKGDTKLNYLPSTGSKLIENVVNDINNKNNKKFNLKDKIKNIYNKSKNYIKENPDNTRDILGLTSNVVNNLIANKVNKNMLNKLKSPIEPTPTQAEKLKTTYNVEPELKNIQERYDKFITDVDENTQSSNVAINRKQKARIASMLDRNNILAKKENIETDLINKDKLNKQNIDYRNKYDYNRYLENKVNFENNVLDKKSENKINTIQNINNSIQDIIQRKEAKNATKNNIITIMAANPNVNPKYLKDLGATFINEDIIKKYNSAKNKKK